MRAQVKAGEQSPFYNQSIEEQLEYYMPMKAAADGLKLVSAIGCSFKRRIAEKKKEPVFEPPTPPL